jgi:hypothetical protein
MSRDVVQCSRWLDEELVCCMEDALSLYLSQEQLPYLLCHVNLDKEGGKRSKDDLVPALTCDRLPRLNV